MFSKNFLRGQEDVTVISSLKLATSSYIFVSLSREARRLSDISNTYVPPVRIFFTICMLLKYTLSISMSGINCVI